MLLLILHLLGINPWIWADVPGVFFTANTLFSLVYCSMALSVYNKDHWRKLSPGEEKEKKVALILALIFFLDLISGSLLTMVLSMLFAVALVGAWIVVTGLNLCGSIYSEFNLKRHWTR